MDGMSEWINDLQGMNRNINTELKKLVDKTSNKLFRKVVQKTPVGKKRGGTLRRNWKNTKTGDYERIVSNNTEYVDFVENGHRLIRNAKIMGYVTGRYMLKRSVEQVESELDSDLSVTMNNILR